MIELTEELVDELVARARSEAPREACGMLGVGRAGLTVFGARNASQSPTDSFLIAPEEQLAILATMKRRGEALAALFHSHPSGSEGPSQRDRVMAEGWPGMPWVILALRDPEPAALWIGYP